MVDYEKLAAEAAGNHREFESFGWATEPEDGENWCVTYTNNRDSKLLEESNAAAIEEIMKPHIKSGDCIPQRHSHWAVGWVDGYAIRVYKQTPVNMLKLDDERADLRYLIEKALDGWSKNIIERTIQAAVETAEIEFNAKADAQQNNITDAFKAYCDIAAALEDYPVLDDMDLSKREHEATMENLRSEIGSVLNRQDGDVEQTTEMEDAVWRWLWDNEQRELDNVDGDGGYPSYDAVERALLALEYIKEEAEVE